jgi:hypothetical protein
MTNASDWRVHVTTADARDAHERLKRAEAAGGPPERIHELEKDYDRVVRTWLRQAATGDRAKDRVQSAAPLVALAEDASTRGV